MMTKLLFLLALTLYCSFSTLHAYPMQRCVCIRTTSTPIPTRVIEKIEVIPVSGRCRWVQIIVTRKNKTKVCIDPKAKWINDLLNVLQNSTTASPTASTTNF